MRSTKRYVSLPFNPKLKARAIALRKSGMLHEVLLWNQLKNKAFNGLDFDRQKIIGNYIVDFYCPEKGVVIEVDGASHEGREDYDAEREAYLVGLGLTVIRLTARDVLKNLAGVMTDLRMNEVLAGIEPPRQASLATPP